MPSSRGRGRGRGRSAGRGRGGERKKRGALLSLRGPPAARKRQVAIDRLHFPTAAQSAVCELLWKLRNIEENKSSDFTETESKKVLNELCRRSIKKVDEKAEINDLIQRLPNGKPVSPLAGQRKMTLNPRVRLELRAEAPSKRQGSRPLVIDRKAGIDALLTKAKHLLKCKKKPESVYIAETNTVLTDLECIPDGTVVICGQAPVVVESKIKKTPLAHKTEDLPLLLGSKEAWGEDEEDGHIQFIQKHERRKSSLGSSRYPTSYSKPNENEFSAARRELPAYKEKDSVIEACRTHRVVIVSAETGAGKSTQVPQFILDDETTKVKKVIVTQPRRIAAISLADRVAKERGQCIGDEVGYSVRLEKRPGQRLEFVTVGVLLQRLQANRDYLTQELSHIIVDEAHERDALTDFLLILLRDEIDRVPDWTLIVMSATLDAALFSTYFHSRKTVCLVTIPGRLFPVEQKFLDQFQELDLNRQDLEKLRKNAAVSTCSRKVDSTFLSPECETPLDCAVIARVTIAIATKDPTTTILVFAPGAAEIDKICRELKASSSSAVMRIPIVPLHGSLPPSKQRSVFSPGRKIVVATNIAETSITIPNVAHVIDTGRVREIRHSNNVTKLAECWISKSAARQRAGRAGRVASGTVWRLYPRALFESTAMPEHAAAEMLRTPLDELVLKILRLGLGQPRIFLKKAIEPPSALAVDSALQQLFAIGAITHTSEDDEEAQVEDNDEHNDDEGEASEELDESPWAEDDELYSSASATQAEAYFGTKLDEDADTEEDNLEDEVETWKLTALGYHISSLPMDSKLAKLLIYGCLFKCVETTLTVAAALSATKQCFSAPFHLRKQASLAKQRLARGSESDLIAVCHAYADWLSASDRRQSCQNNFTNSQALTEIDNLRKDFRRRLVDAAWLDPTNSVGDLVSELRYSLSTAKPLLAAALYPQLARLVKSGDQKRQSSFLVDRNKHKWLSHPSSVNYELLHKHSQRVRYLVFASHIVTTKPYLCDTNLVDPVGLLLFGGRLARSADSQYLLLDDWIPFKLTQHASLCICALKREIDATLSRHVNHGPNIHSHQAASAKIQVAKDVITAPLEDEERENNTLNYTPSILIEPDSGSAVAQNALRVDALASETVSTVKGILALLSSSSIHTH